MSKKPYAEQIRIPTDKASDNAVLRKHSEMKKPYLSDTYEEMEYFADAPVGYAFIPHGSNIDTPWMDTPVPDFKDAYDPWHLTFHCIVLGCYCKGDELCFVASCSQEVIGALLAGPVSQSDFNVIMKGSQICITASDDATGSVEIDINMRALRPRPSPNGTSKFIYGTHYSIHIPACKQKECCTGTVTDYDYGSSAATVAREASAVVYVTGSGGSLTWSISGTGFWFDSGYSLTSLENQGTSVTVYADDNACGSGTITVTDCQDDSVEGVIRCTTGSWNQVDICEFCNGAGVPQPAYTNTEGNTQWTLSAVCTDENCTNYPSNNCPQGGVAAAYIAYCKGIGNDRAHGTVTTYEWEC